MPDDGRPKVLVLTKSLAVGGAERLIVSSARVWDDERFDYRVVHLGCDLDDLVPELRALQVPVDCLGSGLSPAVAWRLRRLLGAYRPDLLHAHLPLAGVLARLTSGVPIVYTEHSDVRLYQPLTRAANRATYRRNRAVIACADAVALSLAGYPGPRPIVIPNGVAVSEPPGAAAAARRELGVDAGQPLVVHVGNVRPEKGHRHLIAATRLLRDRHPDLHVVSIGREGAPGALSALRSSATRTGVADALRFLGPRRDAIGFMAAADVFVNPSDLEGLPLAVLEALALARPVVATRVGGVAEVVKDGETGLTVPPGDPGALADAVSRLLADRAWGARLGAAGRALVERDHGLERMVRATEAVYDGVLRSRSQSVG